MRTNNSGFSLLELTIALAITLCIFMTGFRLFQQNERAFQDQYLISEMQQTARAVAFQISEEIRLAGQGVPAYEASFDLSDRESVAVILSGSDDTHLRFRAGLSNVEASVSTRPVDYSLGAAVSVAVDDAAVFSTALGTSSPLGRFAYIGGSGSNSCWGWARVELNSINAGTNALTLTPRDAGDGCRTTDGALAFIRVQRIALEECVAIYFSGGSVWRTSASDMTNQSAPVWTTASELGRNFTSLTFAYYDAHDVSITPNTLANRLAVARIDTVAVVQTATLLSNGTRPAYELTAPAVPVNVRFR